MGVVGSGRELLTVEAQFVAELGLLACVEVREGMDFSVDSPEEATKGLWNGYSMEVPGKVSNFLQLCCGFLVHIRSVIQHAGF